MNENTTMNLTGADDTAGRVKDVVKRTFYPLFAIFLLMLVASVANAQPYQIIGTENSVVAGDLNKSVTTVQEGTNPLNRFSFARVVKNIPDHAVRGTILLLPPLGSGFQNYRN